jgi:hypothetical protein
VISWKVLGVHRPGGFDIGGHQRFETPALGFA